MLVDRTGQGTGALRRGDVVTRLDGPPEGVVGDTCRRAPRAAHPPAPADHDRPVAARLARPRRRDDRLADDAGELASWPAVAALHPAAPGQHTSLRANPRSTREPPITANPYLLADATLQLAAVWPWSRLRLDPEVVDTAQPPLPRQLAEWMDDGMFARWVLSDLVALDDARVDRRRPAAPGDGAAIAETVTTAGGTWPILDEAAAR